MVAINNNNIPSDPSLRDTGDVDNNDNSTNLSGVQTQGAVPIGHLQAAAVPAAISAFDGVKSASGHSVLNTKPPALSGGQASAPDVASALGRMRSLSSSDPIKHLLLRSSEDGTSPAVPKTPTAPVQIRQTYSTSKNTAVGAAATGGATVAPSVPTTQSLATSTPSSSTSQQPVVSQTNDLNTKTNNLDTTQLSDDISTKADKVISDTSHVTSSKTCDHSQDYAAEQPTVKRFEALGVDKGRAQILARQLDDENNNSGTYHNALDEKTIAAALVAGEELNNSGSAAAKNQLVSQLNSVADNVSKQNTPGAGADAFMTSMNALGSYAVQVSGNAAATSLSSTPHVQRLVPYQTIGQ